MINRITRFLFTFCLGLGMVTQFAFGDSYSYTTTGNFGNGGSSETFTCSTPGTFCFNLGPTNAPSATLTFSGASATSVPGPDLTLGWMSFALNNAGKESYSDDFTLAVNFTEPAGSTGQFMALLSGNVKGDAGGATITFDPSQVFTYSGGSFTVTLDAVSNPLQVSSTNQRAAITGYITPIVAPEPSSMMLLGAGLLGVGGIRRRFHK